MHKSDSYRIGDNIILKSGLKNFFNEEGPHTIIGYDANQYIISSEKGWEAKLSDIEKYRMSKSYLNKQVWVVEKEDIATVIENEYKINCYIKDYYIN